MKTLEEDIPASDEKLLNLDREYRFSTLEERKKGFKRVPRNGPRETCGLRRPNKHTRRIKWRREEVRKAVAEKKRAWIYKKEKLDERGGEKGK